MKGHVKKIAGWFRKELRVSALLLAVAIGAIGFIVLAGRVSSGSSRSVDEHIVYGLRSLENPELPFGPKWLVGMAVDVTALGSVTVITVILLAITGWLLLNRKYAVAVAVLTVTTGAALLSMLLKAIIARERPEVVSSLIFDTSHSFPSGHSLIAIVVYPALGAILVRFEQRRSVKVFTMCVALVIALLIGVTRVYLGAHYPTDVLAGWIAGVSWGLVCWLIALWLQRSGKLGNI